MRQWSWAPCVIVLGALEPRHRLLGEVHDLDSQLHSRASRSGQLSDPIKESDVMLRGCLP